jgi:hypothetical protein
MRIAEGTYKRLPQQLPATVDARGRRGVMRPSTRPRVKLPPLTRKRPSPGALVLTNGKGSFPSLSRRLGERRNAKAVADDALLLVWEAVGPLLEGLPSPEEGPEGRYYGGNFALTSRLPYEEASTTSGSGKAIEE